MMSLGRCSRARAATSPAAVSARKEDIRRRADQSAVRRQWWIARNGYFHQRDIDNLKFLVRPSGKAKEAVVAVEGKGRAAGLLLEYRWLEEEK